MDRFSSLPTVPAETRRLLRQRFSRSIPPSHTIPPESIGVDNVHDELMLQLLMGLTIEHAATLDRARSIYSDAQSLHPTEPSFNELVDQGWIHVIWGRVSIPYELVEKARTNPSHQMYSYEILLERRFSTSYIWQPVVLQDAKLAPLAEQMDPDQFPLSQLTCDSPSWVAARLWDRASPRPSDSFRGLRCWVDRWKLLGSPLVEPDKTWNAEFASAFRDSVFSAIEAEANISDFQSFRNEIIRRAAIGTGCTVAAMEEDIPDFPTTLVGRALWLHEPMVERLIDERYQQMEDFAHLILLLEADINNAECSAAPHPTFLRLVELAVHRAPILQILLFHAQRNPFLVVELLLYAPTSAIACVLIADWQAPSSAWDRELIDRENRANKLLAFSDAVSVLNHYLKEQKIPPAEVADLYRWLQHMVQIASEQQHADRQSMLENLKRELVRQSQPVLRDVVNALVSNNEIIPCSDSAFRSVLDLIAIGRLSEEVDPKPLVEGYVRCVTDDDVMLSARNITPTSAVNLYRLAVRMPDDASQRFLYPVNIDERLSTRQAEHHFTLANEIARALRTHIRLLCRIIIGGGKRPDTEVMDALVSALRSGSVTDFEQGRIGVFAPTFEVRHFFESQDRPIAADIGGALSVLGGSDVAKLLDVVLETDEPMVLAQLLRYCPINIQESIKHRLSEMTPVGAAPILSLDEAQMRIDALLSSGLGEVAEHFIRDEVTLETMGQVPGRKTIRFRQLLRSKVLMEDWAGIIAQDIPSELTHIERETALQTLMFYKAVAALNNPEGDRRGAVQLFSELHQRDPTVAAYSINMFLARVVVLLERDLFRLLEEHELTSAETILAETEEKLAKLPHLSQADGAIYRCYKALLILAMAKPDQAHEILTSLECRENQDTIAAYDTVAMSRLGRVKEAVAKLKEALGTYGDTRVLRAAKSHIENGSPFVHISGLAPDDEIVETTRLAVYRLKQMAPMQQAQVLKPWDESFEELMLDFVVSATMSVGNLVPAMKSLKLDSQEDDVTAVVRELLGSHLRFLNWHVSDHSREGFSAKGNTGEPDLVVRSDTSTLSVIEALVCRDAIRGAELRKHFLKLFGYWNSTICFLVTYTFRSVSETMARIRQMAKNDLPDGYDCMEMADISLTGAQLRGFYARYSNKDTSVKVVFLVLDMVRSDRRLAARQSDVKTSKSEAIG